MCHTIYFCSRVVQGITALPAFSKRLRSCVRTLPPLTFAAVRERGKRKPAYASPSLN